MKLLIVDDQISVAQGLLQGANWKALGFTQVDVAYSSMQAKENLLQKEAEIILCDIEMPVENGLEILKWMRSNEMKTRCLFLTAHAKFEYAKEAIRLGGFDYIVQPAPYAQIVQAVEKAIQEVNEERIAEELQKRGELLDNRREVIVGNLLRDFLMGNANDKDLKKFEHIGLIPLFSQPTWVVLMQPLQWEDNTHAWEFGVLQVAISNMSAEIFSPLDATAVLAVLPQEHCFAIVLQSKIGEKLEASIIMNQLDYLQSVVEEYIHFSSACYLISSENFLDTPKHWNVLLTQCRENVALKSGVFLVQKESKAPKKSINIPQIIRWKQLMQEGYFLAMEQEAFQLLDKLASNNQLDSVTLRLIYQDFVQILFDLFKTNQDLMGDIFNKPEALELYRNGMKTIEDMKALIHHVANYSDALTVKDNLDVVKTVCEYIAENLESELRRETIAEVVHLNADYLSRLFKKETGATIKEYVVQQKMQEARSLLKTTNLSVGFIAAKVGYSNFSHFSNSYKKMYNKSPQEDR